MLKNFIQDNLQYTAMGINLIKEYWFIYLGIVLIFIVISYVCFICWLMTRRIGF